MPEIFGGEGYLGELMTELWKEKYLNKITKGDCLSFLPEIPSQTIDLVVIDPPYNTGLVGDERNRWLRSFFNDNMPPEQFKKFLKNLFKQLFGVLKSNHLLYCFIDFRNFDLLKLELEMAGFSIKNVIVWDKVVHGLGSIYQYRYELIIVAQKGDEFLPFKAVEKDNMFYSDVWRIQRIFPDDLIHPTEKPIKIMENIIKHASQEGDIVLDSCSGGGSTLIAAKQLNRNFIGFEINADYCKIAEERLKKTNTKLNQWFK